MKSNIQRVEETPTGNFIILHRCTNSNSVVLLEVTKNGDTAHRYTPGDVGEVLNDGCRLVIWPNKKSIDNFEVFALDYDNSRIIYFGSDLATKGIIYPDGTADDFTDSNTGQ